MRNLTTAATLCCALLTGPVAAGLYHWTDSQGQRHFSDTPHPDAQPYTPMTSIAPQQRPPKRTHHSSATIPARQLNTVAPKKAGKARSPSALSKRCSGYTNKLHTINAKLRRGHSNRQGNRWREDRRRYQALRWQHCR